ncbi:MAG: hypothetical protein HY908_10110 [Myxococcales bacterium]|nr:hypothetical protein [Myxococcales bacterium]
MPVAAQPAPPPGSASATASPASSSSAPAASASGSAPATPTATVAAPAAPSATTIDGPTYAVRLRDLQQRIDELKEQIRRSHTRLSLLSDSVMNTGTSGSRASIRFDNKFSNLFQLTRATIVLDGTVQYNKSDRSGGLAEQTVIPVFNGSIPPGDHTIQVLINLQGNGFGVFSYMRGYHFEVRSSHSFTAVEGKTIKLRIIAYEKGGVDTAIEERPAVRYMEKVVSGLVDASQPEATEN